MMAAQGLQPAPGSNPFFNLPVQPQLNTPFATQVNYKFMINFCSGLYTRRLYLYIRAGKHAMFDDMLIIVVFFIIAVAAADVSNVSGGTWKANFHRATRTNSLDQLMAVTMLIGNR